jgi:hypothetical protein
MVVMRIGGGWGDLFALYRDQGSEIRDQGRKPGASQLRMMAVMREFFVRGLEFRTGLFCSANMKRTYDDV